MKPVRLSMLSPLGRLPRGLVLLALLAAAGLPALGAPGPAAEAPKPATPAATEPLPTGPSAKAAANLLATSAAESKVTPDGYRRVTLPGAGGQPFPYTVEIPQDWRIHRLEGTASLWLGPQTSKPGGSDPRMIFVRLSTVSLADPAKIAASIRASDAGDTSWSAPQVEVREVGGVKGVLVRTDRGEGEAARSTLTLKLPLPQTSVDFIGSAPQAKFDQYQPGYERILLSIKPVS